MAMLHELKEALQLLNLSPNATVFYLESYRIGAASIGKIAQICAMDRSSAYLAFAQLKEAGLMEEEVIGSRKKIWAKPPKAVLARLRTDIRRLRRQAESIEEVMPNLLAEYSQEEHKPVLQFFSGKEGLARISADILEHAKDEILLLSNFEEEDRVFDQRHHDEFIRERVGRNIPIRVIATDSLRAREMQKNDERYLRQIRIVDRYAFESETYIYEDRVAMLNFHREVMGFVVSSKTFAQTQRWLFEQLWHTHGEQHGNPRLTDAAASSPILRSANRTKGKH